MILAGAGRGSMASITIPLGYHPQGPWGDNPYERHVTDHWTHTDAMAMLRPFGVRRFWLGEIVGRYLVRLGARMSPAGRGIHRHRR